MDSPASCGTNCATPTADESYHSAAGTLHPHRSATCVLYARLHYVVSFSPPKKKFAASLTRDINSQSSHWNNGKMKMKIAYNSACAQTETFNFTFVQQAVHMYFFVPTSEKLLCRTPNIKLRNVHCRRVQSPSHGYLRGLCVELGYYETLLLITVN